MKNRLLATALIATAVLACSACGSGSSSGGKSGGTFRIGTSSRIDSLNPYVAFNQDAYNTFMYIYPYLIQYDRANAKFAPDFALSWTTSQDGKTWTFTTVPNAKWTDGQPLTADDAAWTINTTIKYSKTGTANSAGLIAHITNASAPNPTTLVVHYAAAAGNVLGQFQQFPILPKHVWSQHTGHSGTDLKRFANDAPVVGSGPFKLVSFKKDRIALFQRNGSFYGPKPKAAGFGLQMFSNEDALVAALKSNEIDAIEDVPATAINTLKSAGKKIEQVPGTEQTDFIINASQYKTDHRELLNLKLREAFDHAIDRDQIARVVFLGTAKPAASIIPASTGNNWSNPAVKATTFDLAKANSILDGLGYKRGSDGIRVAGGHPMAYEVITPTDLPSVNRTFQIIQPDFRKVGVQLTQKALDSTTATSTIQGSDYKFKAFDIALWDWVALMDPDFMLSVPTCGQLSGWSDSGFCDKHYDAMYNQQQLSPDQAKRRAIVWKMQEYLAAKRPYIWLASLDHVAAVSPKWTGLVDSPQGPFNSLSKLSLTSAHQAG